MIIKVLMLVFALSAADEAGTMAIKYNSMEECEANRAAVLTTLKDTPSQSGAKVILVAAVCIEPIDAVTI